MLGVTPVMILHCKRLFQLTEGKWPCLRCPHHVMELKVTSVAQGQPQANSQEKPGPHTAV